MKSIEICVYKKFIFLKNIAKKVVNNLGGYGIFGVEFFIKNKKVYFSEVSPRPHDTAFLTLKTQNISIFDIHLRALLQLPIPNIELIASGISKPLIVCNNKYEKLDEKIDEKLDEKLEKNIDVSDKLNIKMCDMIKNTYLYIFGKPNANKRRRMGIIVKTLNNNNYLNYLNAEENIKTNNTLYDP